MTKIGSSLYKTDRDILLTNNINVIGNVYIGSSDLFINDNIYDERKDFIEQSKNSSIVPTVNGDLYIVSDILECTSFFIDNTDFIVEKEEVWGDINHSVAFTAKKFILTGMIFPKNNIYLYSDKMYFRLLREKLNKIKSNINNNFYE